MAGTMNPNPASPRADSSIPFPFHVGTHCNFVCNCAYVAASVDGISDYEQEQEMELEALQSILMDDIKGSPLLFLSEFPRSFDFSNSASLL
jgi:hypothetical protein